ncbi:MAG TPA: glutathione S-transferase family protein [Kofleriaceae bacterium]|nr:glutathione S-transferase family protein [Kofleriaceae bacterium]
MEPVLELLLGNKNYSSWSMRGYLAVAASGLPFRETVVPLFDDTTAGAIAAFSPSGLVPALRHGDIVVWDSLAIGEYVAELAPAAQLWPADRATRALARSVACEMHSGFTALRRDMPMNVRARRPGVGHTPEALASAARVMTIWREQRARHGAAGPYLFGAFTIADVMYAPVATRFRTYGVELDGACQAYVDALFAHPQVAAWLAAAEAEPWSIARYD